MRMPGEHRSSARYRMPRAYLPWSIAEHVSVTIIPYQLLHRTASVHLRIPVGRIGIEVACERLGVSRSTFYALYRWDTAFIQATDMRHSARGHLVHMDEMAVARVAADCLRSQPLAVQPSPRSKPLDRFSPKNAAHDSP